MGNLMSVRKEIAEKAEACGDIRKLDKELREFAIELIKHGECTTEQILYLIYDECPI